MLVVAMFMRKGRLELRLVHPNFLNKNGPAAEDEYPCSEIVKMGNHKQNVRETNMVKLYKKGITKIEGLDKAWIFIERIDLQNNQITTIEGLSRCTKLVVLDLRFNKIEKI